MIDVIKFKEIIEEIDTLEDQGVTSSSVEFQAWRSKTERFLRKNYGENSYEVEEFKKLYFTLTFAFGSTPHSDWVNACKKDLEICKKVFGEYLAEIVEDNSLSIPEEQNNPSDFSKIFVVHGHDEALKQSVARLIEKQNIEAIILSEQANKGKTIIEKLEENSDVGCAICLFTADDTGKANKETDYQARARQNVVLEAGYFMGKLGRGNVIFIAEPNIEMPSDLQGVVYTSMNSWQIDLLKELKGMGYCIDFNKAF